MSHENVETFRRLAEALNSGEVEAILEFYADDVIWYPFPYSPDSADGFHGHDGIREVMGGWIDSFDDFAATTTEIRDPGGDTVLWLGEISGTIRGSGVPMRQPMGAIASEIHAGKIGRVRFFPSWEEAVEAAGLRE